MKGKNSGRGNPAPVDPLEDEVLRTMKRLAVMTQKLKGRVSSDTFVHAQAAALSYGFVYAELTGLPSPVDVRAAEMGWDKVR